MKKIYALVSAMCITVAGFSQSTYTQVYTILQSNCAAYCHNPGNLTGNLNLSGTEAEVHAALVEVTPSNATAAAKKNKRIDPGNPNNSFLFRKINHGMEQYIDLEANEGNAMPDGGAALSNVDREMIRQWILFGAKDTGSFVNRQTIETFYVTQGGQPRVQQITPPAANEGKQLHFGPVFMNVGVEFEYSSKFYVNNTTDVDVTRLNVVENTESHHFALYRYYTGRDTMFQKGLKKVNGVVDEAAIFYNADVIAQWPNSIDLQYPAGTGYFWDSASVVNITYHLINYNDSVIAAEAYMNIYYKEHEEATIPIKTAQIRYGGNDVGLLVIPPQSGDSVFTIEQFEPDSAFYWNIISLQAHTHKYGRDYNVWTRDANGDKDSLVYDGSYDAGYNFDQGVYIWDNPPYRQFDPPMSVDLRKGFIHEATFNNNTQNYVTFGLTTEDEMYVTFMVYYKSLEPISGIDEAEKPLQMKVYPNPATNTLHVTVSDDVEVNDATLKVYDLLGNEMTNIEHINTRMFKIDMSALATGYYTYRLAENNVSIGAGKVILQK